MNSNNRPTNARRRCRRLVGSTVLATIAFIAAGAAQALTVSVGEQIMNGDFGTSAGTLTGWTMSGTVHTRAVTDAINAGGGNNNQSGVFDRGLSSSDVAFFSTDAFAVFGDTSGTIFSTGGNNAPNSGTHTLSQSFTLDSTIGGDQVTSYDLDINIQSAFDGTTGTSADIFQATLILPDLTTVILFSQAHSSTSSGQFSNDPYAMMLLGMLPGDYTLEFSLVEQDQNGNNTTTAAGIDNVSIMAEATLVPLPAAAYLFGSGLLGLAGLARRHRRTA